MIDSPNSLHPLSSNLLPRPSFLEEFLDKGVATRLYNSPWVHVVYFNCVIKDLAWEPLNLPGRKNDYKQMNDQFLVCKQARGHMSSKTQGKVIEDEYARPGKLLAGKVYKKSGVLQWVLIIVTRNRFFKYHNGVLTRYISACQSNENGKVEAAVKTVKRFTPNRKEE